jgi:hypothetical protein
MLVALKALLGAVSKRAWLWLAGVAVLAVSLAWSVGYLQGRGAVRAQFDAYKSAQAREAAERAVQGERVVTKIEVRYRDRIKVVESAAERVVREIPVYVTAEGERGCTLPRGYVWLHDRAFGGDQAAGPAPELPDAPSATTLARAAEVSAANAAALFACHERVRGWEAFYAGVQSALGGRRE